MSPAPRRPEVQELPKQGAAESTGSSLWGQGQRHTETDRSEVQGEGLYESLSGRGSVPHHHHTRARGQDFSRLRKQAKYDPTLHPGISSGRRTSHLHTRLHPRCVCPLRPRVWHGWGGPHFSVHVLQFRDSSGMRPRLGRCRDTPHPQFARQREGDTPAPTPPATRGAGLLAASPEWRRGREGGGASRAGGREGRGDTGGEEGVQPGRGLGGAGSLRAEPGGQVVGRGGARVGLR